MDPLISIAAVVWQTWNVNSGIIKRLLNTQYHLKNPLLEGRQMICLSLTSTQEAERNLDFGTYSNLLSGVFNAAQGLFILKCQCQMEDFNNAQDQHTKVKLSKCSCGATLTTDPCVSDGSSGWSVIHGKFIAINAANMSCACPRSPKGLSPSAHLADGTADLIIVRKCSRLDFFSHLLRHTNKDDQVSV